MSSFRKALITAAALATAGAAWAQSAADAIAQRDSALATSLATAHIAGVERWLRQAASGRCWCRGRMRWVRA